ncbi:acyl carrier protein [Actinosynnema sp. CS-041913]|uniref:acyl carrier protein n=1 Tax=Actinosynnema sp. CS-041913 TaxID=3239917 RepID=UPI003D919506
MTQAVDQHLEELRAITADVMEVEVGEVTDDGLFAEDHEADSLRAIELLARIEKKYKIDIPQEELPNMTSLRALYDVVAKYAQWTE